MENIQASLEAKLDSDQISEDLEYADLVKYIYIDFTTGAVGFKTRDISCRSKSPTSRLQSSPSLMPVLKNNVRNALSAPDCLR